MDVMEGLVYMLYILKKMDLRYGHAPVCVVSGTLMSEDT